MDSKQNCFQTIGNRIKEIRQSRGISQAELAEMAQISLPQYSNIELGKCDPRLGSFIKIAEALQVSTDEILLANTPRAKAITINDYAELLGDCTPAEIDSINKVVKEIKSMLHNQ